MDLTIKYIDPTRHTQENVKRTNLAGAMSKSVFLLLPYMPTGAGCSVVMTAVGIRPFMSFISKRQYTGMR
jgi:hypothetical protein